VDSRRIYYEAFGRHPLQQRGEDHPANRRACARCARDRMEIIVVDGGFHSFYIIVNDISLR
jgi:hypothetical protein